MKNWDDYTDEDNMEFAKGEYVSYNVGDKYKIGEKEAGYVQEKYGFDEKGNNDPSCEDMQAYVVTSEDFLLSTDGTAEDIEGVKKKFKNYLDNKNTGFGALFNNE